MKEAKIMRGFVDRAVLLMFVGLAAAISFSGAGHLPALAQQSVKPSSPIGTWRGDSICVGNRPACKNEDVVYRFEAVTDKPAALILFADKIIEGKREPMGKLEFTYNQASGTLTGEFTRGQTHGLWEFTLSGDKMEGKLFILPERSVARRVTVKRVDENQVPPAPPRDQY
jgi:hypothetical protein